VLITGFGPPHWNHKLEILETNLEKITKHPWTDINIKVCQYASPRDYHIPESLIEKYKLDVIYEPGIVGDFIRKHANPVNIINYDYLLLLLDDIELIDIDFNKLIKYQKEFNLDILSPCLTVDSKFQYPYLLHEPVNYQLKLTNVCEYFCMFFKTSLFDKYYNYIYEDNPWMWGLDLVLGKHLGLKIGIVNSMQMKHWYKNESYNDRLDVNPAEGFHRFINRFNETPDSLALQRSVNYYIVDTC
jgi:hypothetical protein